MRVELRQFSQELCRPLPTSRGSITRRDGVLVRIVEDDFNGWGAAMPIPLPGWTGADGELAPGSGPLSLSVSEGRGWYYEDWEYFLWSLRRWANQPQWLPSDPFASAAVDSARLDLMAQKNRCNQADVLANGSPVADSVALNALVRNADEAASAVADGYLTVKLKVGAFDLEADLNAVRAVREAIGNEVRLRLDANGAWTVEQALDGLVRLEQYDVEYVEEPVHGMEALAYLAERSPVPVAIDESLAPPNVQVPDAISVIVVKPMAYWGPRTAYEAACSWIEEGRKVVITNCLDSGLGQHAALSVAAALPGPPQVHGALTPDLFSQDIVGLTPIRNGRAFVPHCPVWVPGI